MTRFDFFLLLLLSYTIVVRRRRWRRRRRRRRCFPIVTDARIVVYRNLNQWRI